MMPLNKIFLINLFVEIFILFIALFSFLDLILKKSVADQTIFRTVDFLVLKSYNDSLAF